MQLSPPRAMMHFPLVSDISPYFRKILRLREKLYLFTTKFLLPSAKFSDDLFLVVDTKFLTCNNFCFSSIYVFFTYFPCFFLPLCFDLLTMLYLCIIQNTYWTPLSFSPMMLGRWQDYPKMEDLVYSGGRSSKS